MYYKVGAAAAAATVATHCAYYMEGRHSTVPSLDRRIILC